MRSILCCFIIVKICVDFFNERFFSSFYIFCIVYRITIKLFSDNVANCFAHFTIFYQKDKYLVLSKSLLYTLIFGSNMHEGLFFRIFIANKMFESLFIKRSLIKYYYFSNIYIVNEIGILC